MFMLIPAVTFAQTREELHDQIKEKEDSISDIQSRIDDLQAEIDDYLGWHIGAFGTLGFGFSDFENWQKGANPDANSMNIKITANPYANYNDDQYFWRNKAFINLGWQKLDIDPNDGEEAELEQVADILRLSSLYGYKFSDKLAASALMEYNTSILSNFNNPGILDLGIGITWTPITDLTVVIHPLNYHWVFGDSPEFTNALGAKIAADYSRDLFDGLSWTSSFSSFLPYKDTDPTLFEWTWINGFSYDLWKGFGLGFEFGLRDAEVESQDFQSFWVFGVSYTF